MSFGERLRLWVMGFFTTAGERDRFLTLRLSQMRQKTQITNPGLADYEARVFLPALPEQMRDLYRRAKAVRPFFVRVWNDSELLRAMLDYLLAKRIPGARHSLNQFCSTQELQEEFRKTESRSRLRQVVLDRISEYIEGIPKTVMEELETGLKPFYLYKDLVLFDWDAFFAIFQSSEAEAAPEGKVEFKSAAVDRSLDTVEELYLALHYSSRLEQEPEIYLETIHFYFAVQGGTALDVNADDVPETEESRKLKRAILDLAREAKRVRRELSLGNVIRLFRKDPYYRFLAYSPRLRLRDFYYSNLKMRMLQELDNRFHDLRMGVLGKMIQEVFPEGLLEFEYFHPEIQSGVKRSGVATLQVHRPLQYVHTFIEKVYRKGLMDFMRIIGRLLPSRGRQRSVDLTLFIAGLDDVMERIRLFDMSFSPDSDEGKTFYRYRFSTSERDKSQIVAYKALVAQKDRDARGIIEKFTEQLQGVLQAFEAIKKSGQAHINERYAHYENAGAQGRPFDHRLEVYRTKIEASQKIVNQLLAVEREE